ncbi:MAG TPA: radical SAM protein [Candidatus Thermoplasmatota archaeon]|nr:radical SAM protein [Candidatus Thermoplasmatota archaeon]
MASHPLLRVRPAGSFLQGSLPTGCALCEAGTKLVLFLTGVCHYKCFYCPISTEKRMSRDAWANERRLDFSDEAAALQGLADEVRSLGAKGTGITGGDPLYDPERTVKLIRFLKAEFGPKHHIHLYTQIPFDIKWLRAMQEAGLDELRFHPPDETWPDPDAYPQYTRLWLAAREMEKEGLWDVGFEVPCIPGSQEQMWGLVQWLDRHGFTFLNVNEMEFSETNYEQLLARGYRIKDTETSRAMDSEEVAREVMRRASDAGVKTALHFCSSPFKDRVQLRQRLARQAARVAKPYEVATEDGTLVRGVIECPDPKGLAEEMAAAFEIEPSLYEVKADRVLVAPWLLEQFADEVPYPAYFSEAYPTATALEVERVPLNEAARTRRVQVRKGAALERELADLHKFGRPGQ